MCTEGGPHRNSQLSSVCEGNLTAMKAIPHWLCLQPPSVCSCDRKSSMLSYSKYLDSVLQKNHDRTLFKKRILPFSFRIHGDSYWQPHSNSKYQMTQRVTPLGIIQIYGGCECQNSELFLLSFFFFFHFFFQVTRTKSAHMLQAAKVRVMTYFSSYSKNVADCKSWQP